MRVPGCLMLAVVLALVVTDAGAQDHGEEWKCPHPEGWRPSPEELQEKLRAHREWVDNAVQNGVWSSAVPGQGGQSVGCSPDNAKAGAR